MERIAIGTEKIEEIVPEKGETLYPESQSLLDRLDEMHEVASKLSRMNCRPVSIGVIFSK